MKKYLCIICLLVAGCSTGTHSNRFNPDMSRLRQMENAIGCISTYNCNRLSTPHRIRPIPPIPTTQIEFQQLKKLYPLVGN